jgi:hypothetical protein
MKLDSATIQTGSATYCPEDNKLRLYVGRVPRPEYDALRSEGWTATPKQSCQFVAHWTPERRDTALAYSDGIIEDEDQSPAERAADRAERFAEYRDKRTDEATGHADRYDAGPAAHGFQSQARADRSAARHDRIAGRACDAWSKAEYWTRRTGGVISHALHVSTPAVRMGRIKILEAEIRKAEKRRADYAADRQRWLDCAAITDAAEQTKRATLLANYESGTRDYPHPRPDEVTRAYYREHGASLWSLLTMHNGEDGQPITGAEACALYLSTHPEIAGEGDWLTHYRLRLAYENQMMQAAGGRAALVEMQVGGWLGSRQIRKVVRSSVTQQVTSVEVLAKFRTHEAGALVEKFGPVLVNIERITADAYRAPTPEDVAAMEKLLKDERAARKAAAPATIPLVNPTDADAERLQAAWNNQTEGNRYTYSNEGDKGPPKVARMTQAQYSAAALGSYLETVEITGGGFKRDGGGIMRRPDCPTLAKVRAWGYRVVILTDKPQKAFATAVWHDPRPEIAAELAARLPELRAALGVAWLHDMTEEGRALVEQARIVGYAFISSMSQYGLTDRGKAWAEAVESGATVNA